MSMDTSFNLFALFCVAIAVLGLWASNKRHKH